MRREKRESAHEKIELQRQSRKEREKEREKEKGKEKNRKRKATAAYTCDANERRSKLKGEKKDRATFRKKNKETEGKAY